MVYRGIEDSAPATLAWLLGILVLFSAPAGPVAWANDAVTVASPNGKVEFVLHGDAGRLTYEVRFRKQPVIAPARLVMILDGVNLSDGARWDRADRYTVDETYPTRGVHAEAVNHAAGVKLAVRHAASGTAYTLDIRAYNDGVAFRHVIPGGNGPRTPDEATMFVLPAGSTTWYQNLEGHYESVHEHKPADQVPAGAWVAPPLTFKLANGLGYAAITEAGLADYAGMVLQADGGGAFHTVLGHAAHVSYPFRLRYAADVERLSHPATVSGTVTTPWRVVLVGRDLNTLVNSDLVTNLAPPPDPGLFPAGLRTDWIKPGRCVWKYLDGGASNLETAHEFSDLAGKLGFEYNLIEGYWQKWTDAQLRELVAYSRERGVGIWLWKHSKDVRDPAARREFFRRCQALGVAGVKLDFFDHEAREVVDLYRDCLRDAALFHLMVDFHGANKPTGESRTWPNELTREGVYGLEHRKQPAWAAHNTTLPFTRYLAGPGDYTPVVFGERRKETSWAHQIATAAVFTSPLLVYGGHPRSLLENPAAELIKAIPSVWDETVVLPPSEIGELAVFARRKGDAWFLAVLNGPTARTLRVPLTFLGRGTFQSLVARDMADNPAAVKVEHSPAAADQVLTIDLRPGGGFLGRFAP